jgi:hypothetical protein
MESNSIHSDRFHHRSARRIAIRDEEFYGSSTARDM